MTPKGWLKCDHCKHPKPSKFFVLNKHTQKRSKWRNTCVNARETKSGDDYANKMMKYLGYKSEDDLL